MAVFEDKNWEEAIPADQVPQLERGRSYGDPEAETRSAWRARARPAPNFGGYLREFRSGTEHHRRGDIAAEWPKAALA